MTFISKHTCFPLWPAYKMSVMIFLHQTHFRKSVLEQDDKRIPMTAGLFERSWLVWVHCWSISESTGAVSTASPKSASQVKFLRSWADPLRRMEHLESMHIAFSSFWIRTPIPFKRYALVIGSFRHSSATAFLLPLAIAFPMCLRLVWANKFVTFCSSLESKIHKWKFKN